MTRRRGDAAASRLWIGPAVLSWTAGGLFSLPCHAAEYGLQVYPLGTQASMSGATPPPGVYFSDTAVSYNGTGSNNLVIPLGVEAGLGVKQSILVDAATLSLITKPVVGGGQFGVIATLPYGRVRVDAETTFTGPDENIPGGASSDTEIGLGDLSLTALLGWSAGFHHWNLMATAVLPTGLYSRTSLSNVGLHRPAVDIRGGYTWLNLKTGLELSAAAGFTFNAENTATHYLTGDELHIEGSIDKHFHSGWAIGVGGYQYVQLTGDSGSGAKIGSFRGRVTAIGPLASYTVRVGQTPVQFGARWFHEFGVSNRVGGDSISLSIAFPLASLGASPGH